MIRENLKIAIARSQKAYELYSTQGRLFFQAKRIYEANKIVYRLLNEYLFEEGILVEDTFNYLYHLEDWFVQFEYFDKAVKHPSEIFIFERWKGGLAFPKAFVKNITK